MQLSYSPSLRIPMNMNQPIISHGHPPKDGWVFHVATCFVCMCLTLFAEVMIYKENTKHYGQNLGRSVLSRPPKIPSHKKWTFFNLFLNALQSNTLLKTNIARGNTQSKNAISSFQPFIFRGLLLLVSGRVYEIHDDNMVVLSDQWFPGADVFLRFVLGRSDSSIMETNLIYLLF